MPNRMESKRDQKHAEALPLVEKRTHQPNKGHHMTIHPAYKTHGGSITAPRHTCQTLGEIREECGWDRVTPSELARRQAIERRHDSDDDDVNNLDDGTNTHYARQHGDRREYKDRNDLPDPISDDSPIHTLAFYGLGTREIELLERNRCETIGDVRAAIETGSLPRWWQIERATREKIREAVGMVQEQI